jgi:hypothetical protein
MTVQDRGEQAGELGRPALTGRIAGAGIAYAGVCATFPGLTWSAAFAALVPGIAVLVIASRRSRPGLGWRAFAGSRIGILLWLGLVVGFAAWEMYAFVTGQPTFSDMVEPMMAWYPLKFAAWVAWLATGWSLVWR